MEDVSGEAYFPAVHAALNGATGSVAVAMFQMRLPGSATPTHPVRRLIEALADAQQRGVDVSVILDRSFQYDHEQRRRMISRVNDNAAETLQAAGIDISFASPGRLMHQKVIVVDSHTVITGSHNWTLLSMTRNQESGELIRSPEYAAVKLCQMAAISTTPPQPETPDTTTKIDLPAAFLMDPKLAPRMLTQQDVRAFDTYLLLQRYSHPQAVPPESMSKERLLKLDCARLATDLDMDTHAGATAYRRQIIKTLRKLQARYELIEVTFEYAGPATVIIRDVPGHALHIPQAYWTYGWSRTLPMPAKVAYLICLHEAVTSQGEPVWTASKKMLSEKYKIPGDTINAGLLALERLDLITITRHSHPPSQPFAMRRPNTYRLNPVIARELREAMWAALREQYTPALFDQARALADTIDRPNHYDTIEGLLRSMDQYGLPAVRDATATVAALHRSNPMRHVGYIITLAQNARPATPQASQR